MTIYPRAGLRPHEATRLDDGPRPAMARCRICGERIGPTTTKNKSHPACLRRERHERARRRISATLRRRNTRRP